MRDKISIVIQHVEEYIGVIAAREVLLIAKHDLKKGIDLLNETYSAGKASETSAAAHTLAGILGTFKFKNTSALCRLAMEQPVEPRLIAECTQKVTEIIAALNKEYPPPTG